MEDMEIFKRYENPVKGYRFVKKLIELRGHKCECCGNSEWQGQPITLQVHHIDGDKCNNCLENLQLLCPNCHSYTDNFGSKNKKRPDYVSNEDFLKALNESNSIREALIKLGLSDAGANYKRARLLLNAKDISDLPHARQIRIKDKKCPICGRSIWPESNYCEECSKKLQRKVERPNRDELKKMIRELPFTKVAATYGVTDNAIRKWCKREKLPFRKQDIISYSDEEWDKI